MAETRVTKKAAATKAPARKTAPPKKAVAVKKAAPKKAVVVKKAAPVKKVAVKRATPVKKITSRPTTSRGADMLAEAVAAAAPPAPVDAMDALPYAAPGGPAKGGFNKRMVAIAAIVAVAVVASAGTAFALTRDKGPSKAKFIATADALCRPANGPITAIVKPTSYPELATAAGTVVTTTTGQMTQLNALKRPHGADGKAALPTLAAMTATNTAAKALQDAATKKDDAATIAATKQLSAQTTDAVNEAKAYGLAACAIGMQPGVDNVAGGSQSVIKAGFIAKADSLCRASARKADAIREPGNSLQDVTRYFNQNLEVFNALTNDLKALPVAPGDEATVTEMIGAAEKLTGKLAEARDATSASDLARLEALDKETGPLGTAADAKFDAYGLVVCGSNFGDA